MCFRPEQTAVIPRSVEAGLDMWTSADAVSREFGVRKRDEQEEEEQKGVHEATVEARGPRFSGFSLSTALVDPFKSERSNALSPHAKERERFALAPCAAPGLSPWRAGRKGSRLTRWTWGGAHGTRHGAQAGAEKTLARRRKTCCARALSGAVVADRAVWNFLMQQDERARIREVPRDRHKQRRQQRVCARSRSRTLVQTNRRTRA